MRIKILIIITFIVGLCFVGYFYFGVFTPYNYFSANADIKKGIVQIMIYGERDADEKTENEIAKKYGFQYKRVAGCTVSKSLINGVGAYNEVVNDYLITLHGKDWSDKFNKEIFARIKH